MRCWCEPSASISHSSGSYPCCRVALTKAIWEPFGDHDGVPAPSESRVSRRMTHDVDAKALAIVTPGILGPDYFREVAAILGAAAGSAPDLAAKPEMLHRSPSFTGSPRLLMM
jgi:hypothetical protein